MKKHKKRTTDIPFIFNDGGRAGAFPETSAKYKKIGDCVIRAIAIATERNYKAVWEEMFQTAKEIGMFPNSDEISHKYLFNLGWTEVKFGKELVRMNSSRVKEQSIGRWIICYIAGHWVAMKDGAIYDTWDSSENSMGDYSRVFRIYLPPVNQ